MSDNPIEAFFGYLLIAAGGLVALLSGLCSGFFVLTMVQGVIQSPQSLASISPALGLVLVVGGIPLAGGIGMVVLGRAMVRSAKPRPPLDG